MRLSRNVKLRSNRRQSSTSSGSTSIKEFMIKPATYAKDTEQHRTRARGLAKLIAASGVSTLLPTTDAFKDFCKLMDPK